VFDLRIENIVSPEAGDLWMTRLAEALPHGYRFRVDKRKLS
jgi:hypothetical protein